MSYLGRSTTIAHSSSPTQKGVRSAEMGLTYTKNSYKLMASILRFILSVLTMPMPRLESAHLWMELSKETKMVKKFAIR